MSEKDLGLKLDMRRLLWSMGMTSRLNVKLSTHVTSGRKTPRTEEFTDLDVLGVGQAHDGDVYTVIADCKTVRKGANERCFWLRGVSDFFDAESAYLVRSFDVPVSTRQLAERLGVGVLTPDDMKATQEWYPFKANAALDILFDPESHAKEQEFLSRLSSDLDRLVDYRNLGFWIVEPHRTLDGVIYHLRSSRKHLDAKNPAHRMMVYDFAWLFLLSLARCAYRVRLSQASDVDATLRKYLFGGAAAYRDKVNQAQLLQKLRREDSPAELFEVVPDYYGGLLELVTRFLRRPGAATESMRYAEWLAASLTNRSWRDTSVADVVDQFDEIAGKLLADVVKFLCNSSIGEDFLVLADRAQPMTGTSGAAGPLPSQGELLDADRSRDQAADA